MSLEALAALIAAVATAVEAIVRWRDYATRLDALEGKVARLDRELEGLREGLAQE